MIRDNPPKEDVFLKFLSDAIDRFCIRHPKFGIPHLMRYIVVCNILLYL